MQTFAYFAQELACLSSWYYRSLVRNYFPPSDEVIEVLGTPAWWSRLVGTPEVLVEQIQAYADAGVEELILVWFDQDNIEALRGFAESILPRV